MSTRMDECDVCLSAFQPNDKITKCPSNSCGKFTHSSCASSHSFIHVNMEGISPEVEYIPDLPDDDESTWQDSTPEFSSRNNDNDNIENLVIPNNCLNQNQQNQSSQQSSNSSNNNFNNNNTIESSLNHIIKLQLQTQDLQFQTNTNVSNLKKELKQDLANLKDDIDSLKRNIDSCNEKLH